MRAPTAASSDSGYAMVALLIGISIMAVALSVALPTWSAMAKREREEELIFRGQQYARAISLYQRKFANAFPPNFDLLVEQRFLRKKYKDPMTPKGEFQPVYVGQIQAGPMVQTPPTGSQPPGQQLPGQQAPQQGQRGAQRPTPQPQGGLGLAPGAARAGVAGAAGAGLIGVVSKSEATSIRLFNNRNKYNEWVFVATQATTAAGPAPNRPNPPGPIGSDPQRMPRRPQPPGPGSFPRLPGPSAPGPAPSAPRAPI
jgi:type II secretory pathway pseudopilin PulG